MIAKKLSLPRVVTDRANNYYQQLRERRHIKGQFFKVNDKYNIFEVIGFLRQQTNACASACIFLACKQESASRTFGEIEKVSSSKQCHMKKCYKIIVEVLKPPLHVTTSEEYFPRFCSKLDFSSTEQRLAERIAREAVDVDGFTEHLPSSIAAAAAMYMAAKVIV